MVFIFVYFILIFLIWFFSRNESLASIFRSTKQTKWIFAAVSMFMISTTDMGQLVSGIIAEKGIWGLWLIWASLLTTAIVPLVFAPLWVKLNLLTDNQFTLFRFSGKGAIALHKFRAVYVGGLVVAISLAYQSIVFSRILQVFFEISSSQSVFITGVLLSLFALKNTYTTKFQTDILHGIIYILSLGLAFYFMYINSGGYEHILSTIKTKSPDTLSIFPPLGNQTMWNSLFVYLGIQWWSSSVFDGGGTGMSRYTATGTKWGAIKVGIVPTLAYIPIMILVIFMGLMSYVDSGFSNNGELNFVISVFRYFPDYLSYFLLLGFFALFISGAEASLNWGASFLTVDYYKTYVNKDAGEQHYKIISFLSMFLLSVLASVIAYNLDSLELLIKIVFSISAGVAPVFVLRWFWLRINAWSQLSAMLSSGIYTLLFMAFEHYYPHYFDNTGLQFYEWRLIIVTILTISTWLLVTFMTPKDDDATLSRFRKILPPRREVISLFSLAIIVGIGIVFVQTILLLIVF